MMVIVNKYLCVVLCVLEVSFGAAFSEHVAPAPSEDNCPMLLNGTVQFYSSMLGCLPFLTNGNPEERPERPEGKCCKWLKTVLETGGVECLCQGISMFDGELNVTRVSGLPAACRVEARCDHSVAPGAAPALAPMLAPISGGGPTGAPDASPSGASAISAPTSATSSAPAGAPAASPGGVAGISPPTPAASSVSSASVSFGLFVIMHGCRLLLLYVSVPFL